MKQSRISRRKFCGSTTILRAGFLIAPVLKSEKINDLSKSAETSGADLTDVTDNNTEFRIKLTIGSGYAQGLTRLTISLPTQLGFTKHYKF